MRELFGIAWFGCRKKSSEGFSSIVWSKKTSIVTILKKKQQATSHLWVTTHMSLGFQVVLHVPFLFCSDASLESMRHSKASSNTFWTELNQLLNQLFPIFFSIRFSRCQNWAVKVWFQSVSDFSLETMTHCKASLNSLNGLFQVFFSIRFSRCQNRPLKVWFQSKCDFSLENMTLYRFNLKRFWTKF